MALTRDFKETIRARVKRDPGYRKALLREGIENFLSGDVETGKIILRDFINATVGFTKLSDVTHRSAKSLMRMLGPSGNPQARNLFEIVAYLQHAEGVRFEVRSARGTISKCDEGISDRLWFAKTLADCKINRIAATVSPAFCYNFSHVALCQSLFRNGGSPVARATKSSYRESRLASTTRRDQAAASAVTARSPR